MIKKLHYCWFGGPVPNAVLANVQRWKALNPEFELIEWNETILMYPLLNLAEDV